MKKWTLLPFALLTSMLAAQSSSPVPAGTALMVRLDTTLATFSNKAGDQFRGQHHTTSCHQWPNSDSSGIHH